MTEINYVTNVKQYIGITDTIATRHLFFIWFLDKY